MLVHAKSQNIQRRSAQSRLLKENLDKYSIVENGGDVNMEEDSVTSTKANPQRSSQHMIEQTISLFQSQQKRSSSLPPQQRPQSSQLFLRSPFFGSNASTAGAKTSAVAGVIHARRQGQGISRNLLRSQEALFLGSAPPPGEEEQIIQHQERSAEFFPTILRGESTNVSCDISSSQQLQDAMNSTACTRWCDEEFTNSMALVDQEDDDYHSSDEDDSTFGDNTSSSYNDNGFQLTRNRLRRRGVVFSTTAHSEATNQQVIDVYQHHQEILLDIEGKACKHDGMHNFNKLNIF